MRVVGTDEYDRILGRTRHDVISGGGGADILAGGRGRDVLNGGDGADTLYSGEVGEPDDGTDADRLYGGDGDDRVIGGYGDLLDGGAGHDALSLDLSGAPTGLALDLNNLVGGAETRIDAGIIRGFETLGGVRMTAFADTVVLAREGGGGVNGGDGDDVIDATRLAGLVGSRQFGVVGGTGHDVLLLDPAMLDVRIGWTSVDPSGAITIWANRAHGDASFVLLGVEEVRFGEVVMRASDLPHGGRMRLDGEFLFGEEVDDVIAPGSPAADGTAVTDAADTLYGGAGDDVLDGGLGGDTMWGGEGADTFFVDDVGDRLRDTSYHDTVIASVSVSTDWNQSAGRVVLTGDGHISATGATTHGIVVGNAGDNVMDAATVSYENAGSGVRVALYLTGPQHTGGAGRDTLRGTVGLRGSVFDDVLSGNQRDNELEGNEGDDLLDGRGGVDTASYAAASSGVVVDLSATDVQDTGGAGRDRLISIESLIGSRFSDVLRGGAGPNRLDGGDGADVIHVGDSDTAIGGAGADLFVLDAALSGTAKVIGFSRSQGDRIDLSGIDADAHQAGDQSFRIVRAFSGAAGELVIGSRRSRALAGDMDGDGVADFTVTLALADRFDHSLVVL